MTDWIILRTSAGSTLRLVETLTDAGFEAWTPVEVREVLKGKNRAPTEQAMPILPEYVFARAEHLTELLAAAHSSGLPYRVWDRDLRRIVLRSYPKFSVFRLHDQVRPQPDRQLASLRQLEAELQVVTAKRRENARRKGPVPRFTAGEIVRTDGAGYEGLDLTVVESNEGKLVTVAREDWMWTVEISAWKLRRTDVPQASPEQAAALAA